MITKQSQVNKKKALKLNKLSHFSFSSVSIKLIQIQPYNMNKIMSKLLKFRSRVFLQKFTVFQPQFFSRRDIYLRIRKKEHSVLAFHSSIVVELLQVFTESRVIVTTRQFDLKTPIVGHMASQPLELTKKIIYHIHNNI